MSGSYLNSSIREKSNPLQNKGVIHLRACEEMGSALDIIGIEAYEKSEHDKVLLRLLAKGDKEIEIGEGYDLDIVLAEADLILSREPS